MTDWAKIPKDTSGLFLHGTFYHFYSTVKDTRCLARMTAVGLVDASGAATESDRYTHYREMEWPETPMSDRVRFQKAVDVLEIAANGGNVTTEQVNHALAVVRERTPK